MAEINDGKKWLKENQQGLGDKVDYLLNETPVKVITKVAKKVLFKDQKDCGCEQRRKKLNKLLPSRQKQVRCFTDIENEKYKEFKEIRTINLNENQIDFICELYANVFEKPLFKPKKNQSKKPIFKMIEMLDKVFENK